jgi:hypothetical protein
VPVLLVSGSRQPLLLLLHSLLRCFGKHFADQRRSSDTPPKLLHTHRHRLSCERLLVLTPSARGEGARDAAAP